MPFLFQFLLSEYGEYCTHSVGGGMMTTSDKLLDISRNSLLGNRKKIAKFLMRTFTCRSTFLYALDQGEGKKPFAVCGR